MSSKLPRRLMRPSALLVAGAVLLFAPDLSAQSESSTTAAPLPGEGGGLPRAPMPTGGVDDGSQEALKERLQEDAKEKEAAAEAEEPPPEEAPAEEPPPEEAPAEEPPPEAATPDTDEAEAPKEAPEGDEAEPMERDPDPALVGAGTKGRTERGGAQFGDYSDVETNVFGVRVGWTGYLRMVAQVVENDPQSVVIGRNDGFRLANARLALRATKGDLLAFVSLEAAVGLRESFNDPNQEFRVLPRDAYLRYDLSRFALITAGRFKTPYDLGALESSAFRTFIFAPLESRGVLPTLGFEQEGMTQDRQIGLMVHRDHVGITEDGFDVGYALALTNGNTGNLALNDNDRPAAFGRLSLYWGKWVALNVAGFTDTVTTGEFDNRLDTDVRGLEVSMLADLFGLQLEGQLLFQNRSFEESTGQEDQDSIGGHAQFSYTLWGVSFAYRFAIYDPIWLTGDEAQQMVGFGDADQVIEHTIGLGYQVQTLPLRFILNGTVVQEQEGRKLSNNRLTLLSQFNF